MLPPLEASQSFATEQAPTSSPEAHISTNSDVDSSAPYAENVTEFDEIGVLDSETFLAAIAQARDSVLGTPVTREARAWAASAIVLSLMGWIASRK